MSPKKDNYVPPDEIDGRPTSKKLKEALRNDPKLRGNDYNAQLLRATNYYGAKAASKVKDLLLTNPRTGRSGSGSGSGKPPPASTKTAAAESLKTKNATAEQNRRDKLANDKPNKTEEGKKSNFSGDFNEAFGRSKDAAVARGANNRSKKALTAKERMKGSKYDKEFGTAFKAARKAGMKAFMHGGKKYNTKTEEEKDSGRKMSGPAEKTTRKNQASSTYGKKKKPNVSRSEAKPDRQTKLKGADKLEGLSKDLAKTLTKAKDRKKVNTPPEPKKSTKKRSKPDNFYGPNGKLKGAGGQTKAALSNLFGGRK
mgnify:CR=1 FL=1